MPMGQQRVLRPDLSGQPI